MDNSSSESFAKWRRKERATSPERYPTPDSALHPGKDPDASCCTRVLQGAVHQDVCLFNDWKLAGVVTVGSGRPVDARVFGDPNQDGNTSNDRLSGYGRNVFLGPDYATTDLRLTRRLYVRPRLKLELMAEVFNALNRDNRRVQMTVRWDSPALHRLCAN